MEPQPLLLAYSRVVAPAQTVPSLETGAGLAGPKSPQFSDCVSPELAVFVDYTIEYVKGHVHTNHNEDFWSLLKRMLCGTCIKVQPFPLFRYLDEQAFWFSNR